MRLLIQIAALHPRQSSRGPSLRRPVLNPLECLISATARGTVSRVGGSISQRLSGFDGAARVLKKHEVLVVELHYRENERRADTEQ